MSSPAPSQGLTAEEELSQMMRQVTPVDVDDDNDLFGGGGQRILSSPTPGTATPIDRESDGIAPSSGPLRSNEQRAARRLADRLNLLPYQKEALKDFVKVDIDVALFSILPLMNKQPSHPPSPRMFFSIPNSVLLRTNLTRSLQRHRYTRSRRH
jgi:hypothetical protein